MGGCYSRRPDKEKGKSHYHSFSAQGYLFLGELDLDRGEGKKASEKLRKAKEMFQGMGMDYWLCNTQEILERL